MALLICASPPTATADLAAVTSPSEIPGEITKTFDGVGTGPIEDPYMFYDGGAYTGIVFGDVSGASIFPDPNGGGRIEVSPFPEIASLEIIFNDD